MKRYRVDISTRGKTGPKVTIRLRASGIQEAVQRARTLLRDATDPGDIDRLDDLVYQVVDLESERRATGRAMSPADGTSALDRAATEPDLPRPLTPEDVHARMAQQGGHSNRVYVRGGDLAAMPGVEGTTAPGGAGHRPASDVRRTLDQPPRWTRQMVPDATTGAQPSIRGDRLKPVDRARRIGGTNHVMARGQYEAARSWLAPDNELSALAHHQVSMAWDHIHCQAIQAMLPLDGGTTFVVIAALGELQEKVVGSHAQLPNALQSKIGSARKPLSIQVDDARIVYEFRNGAITALPAHAVLWTPIVVGKEVVAIVLAINPRDADEFGYGDLTGAAYLAASFGTALAAHVEESTA